VEFVAQSGTLETHAVIAVTVAPVNDPPVLKNARLEIGGYPKQIKVVWDEWVDPDEESVESRNCSYEWFANGQVQSDLSGQSVADWVNLSDAKTVACRVTPADAYEAGRTVTLCVLHLNLYKGWNLVGLPIVLDSGQDETVFENSRGEVFTWESDTYQRMTVLGDNTAFWMHVDSGRELWFTGHLDPEITPSVQKNDVDTWQLSTVPFYTLDEPVFDPLQTFDCWSWDAVRRLYYKPSLFDPTQGYWLQ
jgi:hypothetical protein